MAPITNPGSPVSRRRSSTSCATRMDSLRSLQPGSTRQSKSSAAKSSKVPSACTVMPSSDWTGLPSTAKTVVGDWPHQRKFADAVVTWS